MEVLSGYPRKSTIQDFQSRHSKELNVIYQEFSKTTLDAAAATKAAATMDEKSKVTPTEAELAMEEKTRRRKRKISAVPSTESTNMYVILPSDAELHKAEISEIIAREKKQAKQ